MRVGVGRLLNRVLIRGFGTANFQRRIEWNKMLDWSGLTDRDSLLEVACGDCGLLNRTSKLAGPAIGIDISRASLEKGGTLAKESCLLSDANIMPFRDECFDKILCSSSFEFLDASLALGEMRRVLKRGGSIVLTADSNTFPLPPGLGRKYRTLNKNAERFFTSVSLRETFQVAGLLPVRVQYLSTSRVSDFFMRLGIMLRWKGYLWMVLSVAAYYPSLIADFIAGSSKRGHGLIIQAKK